MAKRLKFRPTVHRVKLNPEQAVLFCDCYEAGQRGTKNELGLRWACTARNQTDRVLSQSPNIGTS
jgi:hypothetical protein